MKNKESFEITKNEKSRVPAREDFLAEIMADSQKFDDHDYYIATGFINGRKMNPNQLEEADAIIKNWWKEKHQSPVDIYAIRQSSVGNNTPKPKNSVKQLKNAETTGNFNTKKESFININIGDLTQEIDKINLALIKEHKLPIASASEVQDAKMGLGTISPGWFHYWKNKLSSETATLPDNVKKVVIKLQKIDNWLEVDNADKNVFRDYTGRRSAAMRFSLSKRTAMAKLKEKLKDIDERKDYEPNEVKGRRVISYDMADESLYVEYGGKRFPIKIEDVAADVEWGIKYMPDKSVPDAVWRRIRKESDVGETRKQIERLFDSELASIEHVSLPIGIIPIDNLIELSKRADINGIVAERMARTLLKRKQWLGSHQIFKVESSNALEDTQLKYDFKVIFVEKRRGIGVEDVSMTRDEYVREKKAIGFQFTVGHNGGKKAKQIEEAKKRLHEEKYERLVKRPVDDIVLVKMRFETFGKCFKRWDSEGRPSGGPEQFLSEDERIKIIDAVTRGSLSDEERKGLGIKENE